jgi:hypothetical protein
MKLFDFIDWDLLEESVQDVEAIRQKYYSEIGNRFHTIAVADKFTKLDNDGNIVKLGKYARLLLNLYQMGGLLIEDLPLAKDYINILYDRNVSVPWHQIRELSDLYPYVQKYIAKNDMPFQDVLPYLEAGKDYIKHEPADSNYEIYQPLTEKGAAYLGVGAEWCTTWGPYSLNPRNKSKSNRFAAYSKEGPLFILVNKTDNNDRAQFHFKDEEFKNLSNRDADTKKYFEDNGVFNFFFPFEKDGQEISDEQLKEYKKFIKLLPKDKEQTIKEKYAERFGSFGATSLNIDIDEFDEEEYFALVPDKSVRSIEITRSGDVSFQVDLPSNYNVESLDRYLSSLHHSKNDSSPSEWMGEFEDDLHQMFMSFAENNQDFLIGIYGNSAKDYKGLWDRFGQIFIEKFYDDYASKFDEINYANVDAGYDRLLRQVEERITVNRDNEVVFELNSYNDFVDANQLNEIDNFNKFLERYIDFYDLNLEDYGADIDWEWPHWGDFENEIKEWFESGVTENMSQTRKQLNDILSKFFKKYGHTYEDNDKLLRVDDSKVDYENQSVYINYVDKNSKENFNGYVKIENLPKYVSMNMLAETYFKFKRLIISK